jgi:hypothetical protein
MDEIAEGGVGRGAAGPGRDDRYPGAAHLKPLLELQTGGGAVVITRFECPNLPVLAYLLVLHWRVKRDVRRHTRGFVGVRKLVDVRQRVLLSISLWEDVESIYWMGAVPRHIVATRLPGRLGVNTCSGVYPFAGDWRRVLFRSDRPPRSPLRPWEPEN